MVTNLRKLLMPLLLLLICFGSAMALHRVEYDIRDKQIFADVVEKLSPYKHLPTNQLVVKAGVLFIDAPYAAKTLEGNDNEVLVVNLREFDCTTYIETCLALALVVKKQSPDFDDYIEMLKRIRYRNGMLKGYESRLHYFSDWMYDNAKKKILTNIAENNSDTLIQFSVNFMSTHPQNYQQLLKDSGLVEKIAFQEQMISQRVVSYVPTSKVQFLQTELQDGDIIGITTNINGMDVKHVVMVYKKDDKLHILHASQKFNKVLISEETLEEYLKHDNRATGIIVGRPL